ncbi:hypothetical protein [Butyrivibrio sp. AE3004]|uniref:hypothetical protein n=1 Tax=Butyrivibrio sp. AE3004 TaxID=1506994 RepID=UPI0004943BAA|nr:hypothetical protein [Butyrivibrio sp. AE3004]
MGARYHGKLIQDFSIDVDISQLREYIENKILESITKNREILDPEITFSEIDEEDNILILEGSYNCIVKGITFEQTPEILSEDDMERPYIYGGIAHDVDSMSEVLLSDFPEDIRKLIRIKDVYEGSDNISMDDE